MFRSGWSEALDFVPLRVTKNCFFFLTLLYKLQGFNKVWQLIPAFKGIVKNTGISHTSSVRNAQAAPSVLMLRAAPQIQSSAGGTPGIPGSPAGARLELNNHWAAPTSDSPAPRDGQQGQVPRGLCWTAVLLLILLSAQAKAGRPQTRKLLWKECFPNWSCWNSCQHQDDPFHCSAHKQLARRARKPNQANPNLNN